MSIDKLTGLYTFVSTVAALIFVVVNSSYTKKTRHSHHRRWQIILWALVLIGLPFIPSLRNHLLQPNQPPLVQGLIADLVSTIGLIAVIWGRRTLGTNWSVLIDIKNDHQLITSGPYRYVRHPMYTGLLSLLLGMAIWHGSVLGYCYVCFITVTFWIKAKQEEKLLSQHFSDYRVYQKKTKALIPFLL